jgi:hypothetical protein
MEITELRTEKRMPPSLRGTVYEAMAKAVAEELWDYRMDIKQQKQSLWDVLSMDRERLLQISKMLNAPFTVSLDETEEFIRQEILAIPFKIKYKGTATLYKSFFLAAGRIGQVFIYYYQSASNAIIRSAKNPIANLIIIPPGETFLYESENDFSGFVENALTLDSNLRLDIAAGGVLWTLDNNDNQITINHIGLEFYIDRIIRKKVTAENGDSVEREFLMTNEYLNFIRVNTEYGRRAKEVPHIGSQLSIQTDLSGTFDSHSPGDPYTIPAVKVKAATRADALSLIESVDDLTYVEFGTGSQKLPSKVPGDAAEFPEKLSNRVSRTETIYRERFESVNSIGVIGEYIGQSINRYTLAVANGEDKEFRFSLPYKPVRRGNVKIVLETPGAPPKVVTDDRVGNLIGDFGQGVINYNTGEIFLTTSFTNSSTEIPLTPPPYNNYTEPNKTHYEFGLTYRNFTRGSVILSFHVGDGENERIVIARDDGDGKLQENSHIIDSSIDYEAGRFYIEFAQPLTPGSKFEVTSTHPVDYLLPDGAEIIADYYFTQSTIEITEAGLFSSAGKLISYATFPPFEFYSPDFHLNLLFAFRKDKLFDGTELETEIATQASEPEEPISI